MKKYKAKTGTSKGKVSSTVVAGGATLGIIGVAAAAIIAGNTMSNIDFNTNSGTVDPDRPSNQTIEESHTFAEEETIHNLPYEENVENDAVTPGNSASEETSTDSTTTETTIETVKHPNEPTIRPVETGDELISHTPAEEDTNNKEDHTESEANTDTTEAETTTDTTESETDSNITETETETKTSPEETLNAMLETLAEKYIEELTKRHKDVEGMQVTGIIPDASAKTIYVQGTINGKSNDYTVEFEISTNTAKLPIYTLDSNYLSADLINELITIISTTDPITYSYKVTGVVKENTIGQ